MRNVTNITSKNRKLTFGAVEWVSERMNESMNEWVREGEGEGEWDWDRIEAGLQV